MCTPGIYHEWCVKGNLHPRAARQPRQRRSASQRNRDCPRLANDRAQVIAGGFVSTIPDGLLPEGSLSPGLGNRRRALNYARVTEMTQNECN
jgi:hypothetical protein